MTIYGDSLWQSAWTTATVSMLVVHHWLSDDCRPVTKGESGGGSRNLPRAQVGNIYWCMLWTRQIVNMSCENYVRKHFQCIRRYHCYTRLDLYSICNLYPARHTSRFPYVTHLGYHLIPAWFLSVETLWDPSGISMQNSKLGPIWFPYASRVGPTWFPNASK